MRQGGGSGDRIRPARILSHFAVAAIGLVLWIVYVAADEDALAWVAFALLAVVALLGFSMLFIWLRQRSQTNLAAGGAEGGAVPAERHFPNIIVGAHGVLAATTLVLVFLVAIGVGD